MTVREVVLERKSLGAMWLVAGLTAVVVGACAPRAPAAGSDPADPVPIETVVVDPMEQRRLDGIAAALARYGVIARTEDVTGALARVAGGEPFYFTLDACEMDDTGWTQGSDPYAALLCGSTYFGVYSGGAARYEFTGILESTGQVFSAGSPAGEPGTINIWGVTFSLTDSGVVTDGADRAVGRIGFGVAAPVVPAAEASQ